CGDASLRDASRTRTGDAPASKRASAKRTLTRTLTTLWRDDTGNRQVFHRNAQPNLCPMPHAPCPIPKNRKSNIDIIPNHATSMPVARKWLQNLKFKIDG
ncbi:MAG: hypothetical protein ICV78_25845, partial [Tolypothrix sp. Co-bin9]|nr:hypothetical protein [Tolypothrix sp. Co-bin9]